MVGAVWMKKKKRDEQRAADFMGRPRRRGAAMSYEAPTEALMTSRVGFIIAWFMCTCSSRAMEKVGAGESAFAARVGVTKMGKAPTSRKS